MEHSWQPQLWTEPAHYDEAIQSNSNLAHYGESKDYHRGHHQDRPSPLDYNKSLQQHSSHTSKKSKYHSELRPENPPTSTRFASHAHIIDKEEDTKSQYMYRKPIVSSPNHSASPNNHTKIVSRNDRKGYDRVKLHTDEYPQRTKVEERRSTHNWSRYNAPSIKKSVQSKREPLVSVSPASPPSYTHHKSKRHTPKQSTVDGLCTSCVLCRVPNNYSNPCCLCELPVCENCLRTNKNISSWRCRINSFVSKDVKKPQTRTPRESSSESSNASSFRAFKGDGKSIRSGSQNLYKNYENGYLSNSSSESLKQHSRNKRGRRSISKFYRSNHRL